MNLQTCARPTLRGWCAKWLFLVLLSLTTTGCALNSQPTPPVVVPQVVIPQPPQVGEPQPSGYYWQKLSDLRMKRCLLEQKRQALLKLTVTPCEPS